MNESNNHRVTVYGPGLSHGVAGEAATFTVYAKGTEADAVNINVEGPAKAAIKLHDNRVCPFLLYTSVAILFILNNQNNQAALISSRHLKQRG